MHFKFNIINGIFNNKTTYFIKGLLRIKISPFIFLQNFNKF